MGFLGGRWEAESAATGRCLFLWGSVKFLSRSDDDFGRKIRPFAPKVCGNLGRYIGG